MKKTGAAFILCFSFVFTLSTAAQTRGGQRMQLLMGSPARPDLNSTLIDLDHISLATQNDVRNLHVEKWKAGWKTGFLKSGAHKDEAEHVANSLQRNLSTALPAFIRDVQTSRGGVSATFRLYDDVSLLCEALDSLITTSEAAGKKSDAAALEEDYSALTRVRRSLATYVQQSATTLETHGKAPTVSFITPRMPLMTSSQRASSAPLPAPQRAVAASSTQVVTEQGVKKIIIDDTIPEKKSATPVTKKKATVAYSNL